MSVLLAFALASTMTGASTPLISPDKAPIEPWKMRTIISVTPGMAPTCQFETEGALKAFQDTQCELAKQLSRLPGRSPAIEGRHGPPTELREPPRSTADLIIEISFVVGQKPGVPQAPRDPQLIFHSVAEIQIDASGTLESCQVGGIGIMPPGVADICTMVPKNYTVPAGGQGPLRAYLDVAWFIRVNSPV